MSLLQAFLRKSIYYEYNHSYAHANNYYKQSYGNTGFTYFGILKNNQLLKFSCKIVVLPERNMLRIYILKGTKLRAIQKLQIE